jgi:hypothetical protein
VGWSDDYIVYGQPLERVFENRTRQMWTIAVEGNRALLKTFCEVGKYRSEAGGEAIAFLRDYAYFLTCQMRQLIYVRDGTHNGNVYVARRQ